MEGHLSIRYFELYSKYLKATFLIVFSIHLLNEMNREEVYSPSRFFYKA
jgi:hypothetical protein